MKRAVLFLHCSPPPREDSCGETVLMFLTVNTVGRWRSYLFPLVSSYLFQKASDHELEEMFYDKFEVTLDDVQVMIFGKGRPELMLQF